MKKAISNSNFKRPGNFWWMSNQDFTGLWKSMITSFWWFAVGSQSFQSSSTMWPSKHSLSFKCVLTTCYSPSLRISKLLTCPIWHIWLLWMSRNIYLTWVRNILCAKFISSSRSTSITFTKIKSQTKFLYYSQMIWDNGQLLTSVLEKILQWSQLNTRRSNKISQMSI